MAMPRRAVGTWTHVKRASRPSSAAAAALGAGRHLASCCFKGEEGKNGINLEEKGVLRG